MPKNKYFTEELKAGLLAMQDGKLMKAAEFHISKHPEFIRLISGDTFILIVKSRTDVYEITDNRVKFIREIKTATPVIEAIPVPHQNGFGLIEQNGTIAIHDF